MKQKAAGLISILLICALLPLPVLAGDFSDGLQVDTVLLEGVFQFGDFHGEQRVPGGMQLFSLGDDLTARLNAAMSSQATEVNVQDLLIANTPENKSIISKAFSTCINSNPAFFNVKRSVTIYSNDAMILFLGIQYEAGAADRSAQFEQEAAKILQRANIPADSSMTQTEKALALHDQLALELSYHHEASVADGSSIYPDSFNAYGAVVNKRAVCQGYALAYIELLKRAGINAMVVPSANLNHMWNLVELTDVSMQPAWYHVDCTWDDPTFGSGTPIPAGTSPDGNADWSGYAGHTYFMRTDAEELQGSRTWNTEEVPQESASTPHPNKQFWEGVYSGMFYYNGTWTYLDSWSSSIYRGILKATPYGTGRNATNIGEATSYATLPVRNGAKLYYYRFDNSYAYDGDLYFYDMTIGEERILHSISADRFVAELYAANDTLTYTELYVSSKQRSGTGPLGLVYTGTFSAGDINGDGRISIVDALLVLNHRHNRIAFTAKQQVAADVNGDGYVNEADAALISDYLAGKRTSFPING